MPAWHHPKRLADTIACANGVHLLTISATSSKISFAGGKNTDLGRYTCSSVSLGSRRTRFLPTRRDFPRETNTSMTSQVKLDPFELELDDLTSPDDIESSFYPGVYALLDVDGKPLYVGQSGDIPQRLREHRKTKRWYEKVDRVLVLLAPDLQDRLLAETVLQLKYRPRHCRAIKLGFNKDGTLTELQFLRCQRRS